MSSRTSWPLAFDGKWRIVAITQVDFNTGRLHDLASLTSQIHEAGWTHDLRPVPQRGRHENRRAAVGVDLAVGCGYKYLNGGPGAPGYIYVSPRLQERIGNPITGWFGHEDPFLFAPTYQAASGTRRMQAGTPNVLSLVALDEALAVFADVDLDLVRAKSVALTSLFIELVDQMLATTTELVTPRSADERGSQVTLRHPHASKLVGDLAGRGVIVDHRPPDLIRFGFSPLFNSYSDALEAATALSQIL